MSPFWTSALIDVLLVIYVIDCAFMGLLIMMQRSKQEGLGAAFGGGFTDSIWGAQTSNVLVKGTVWCAIIFFVLSVTLARLYSQEASTVPTVSPVQQELTAPVLAPNVIPSSSSTTNAIGQPIAPPSNTSAPANIPTPVAPAGNTHGSSPNVPVTVPTVPNPAPAPAQK